MITSTAMPHPSDRCTSIASTGSRSAGGVNVCSRTSTAATRSTRRTRRSPTVCDQQSRYQRSWRSETAHGIHVELAQVVAAVVGEPEPPSADAAVGQGAGDLRVGARDAGARRTHLGAGRTPARRGPRGAPARSCRPPGRRRRRARHPCRRPTGPPGGPWRPPSPGRAPPRARTSAAAAGPRGRSGSRRGRPRRRLHGDARLAQQSDIAPSRAVADPEARRKVLAGDARLARDVLEGQQGTRGRAAHDCGSLWSATGSSLTA